jgi:hypothetical protein
VAEEASKKCCVTKLASTKKQGSSFHIYTCWCNSYALTYQSLVSILLKSASISRTVPFMPYSQIKGGRLFLALLDHIPPRGAPLSIITSKCHVAFGFPRSLNSVLLLDVYGLMALCSHRPRAPIKNEKSSSHISKILSSRTLSFLLRCACPKQHTNQRCAAGLTFCTNSLPYLQHHTNQQHSFEHFEEEQMLLLPLKHSYPLIILLFLL